MPAALWSPETLDALGMSREELDVLSCDELIELVTEALHDELDSLDRLKRTYPMAVVPLWVRSDELLESLPGWALEGMPEMDTDQRQQVISQLEHRASVCSGGNRAGKTFGAYCADIACALGRDHPMVAEWMRLNRIPEHLVPLGPGRVIIAAPSSAHSRKTHRPAIDALLPRFGVHWYDKNSKGEAFVEIECPGYGQRARIDFMSVDQGHEKFKGTEARRYHIDEEPLGVEGQLVFKECQRGASAEGGHVVITATPQSGETWMTTMMRDASACHYSQLDALGNYLVNDYQALLAHFRAMDPQERRNRRYGDVVPREGLIYHRFTRGDGTWEGMGHVCPDMPIPDDWMRFRGSDYGLKNPTVVVWAALDPDDDMLVVYRVLYRDHLTGRPGEPNREPAPETYEEIGALVHEVEGATQDASGIWRGHTEVIEMSWGDPSAAQALETWRRMDLPFEKADNEVQSGISKVHTRMALLSDQRPRLKICASCVELIAEIERYRRDPRRRDGAPLKVDDHAVDALRYLVMGVERYLGR